MKTCSKCNNEKSETEFAFRNKSQNIQYSHCKDCQRILRKNSYEKNKDYYLQKDLYNIKEQRRNKTDFIRSYKEGKPCKDCGIVYPHYVMDFDHLPQFKKEIKIASFGKTYSIERLLKEFEKCEIVCANCHRVRTWTRKMEDSVGFQPTNPECLPDYRISSAAH